MFLYLVFVFPYSLLFFVPFNSIFCFLSFFITPTQFNIFPPGREYFPRLIPLYSYLLQKWVRKIYEGSAGEYYCSRFNFLPPLSSPDLPVLPIFRDFSRFQQIFLNSPGKPPNFTEISKISRKLLKYSDISIRRENSSHWLVSSNDVIYN